MTFILFLCHVCVPDFVTICHFCFPVVAKSCHSEWRVETFSKDNGG